MSANPRITSNNVAGLRVGVLDFIGRERLPAFVQDAFGFPFPKLKRMNKKEDLLSLLGMESVDAAIVEAADLAELRAGTKLRLYMVMESKPMDSFPVLAAPPAQNWDKLKTEIANPPKTVLQSLDVEGWE